MQMKKKMKDESGSMAVYVAVALTGFLIILTAIYIKSTSVRNAQLTTITKIKESYEQGNNNIDETYQRIVDEMVYFEDFNEVKNYGRTSTEEPVSVNGIITLKSTGMDPSFNMNDVTYFNPREYRYIDVKYRTSSQAGTMQFVFENATLEEELVCDGEWHTVTFDFGSKSSSLGNSPITGWIWKWASESDVTMDVDYIRIYK